MNIDRELLELAATTEQSSVVDQQPVAFRDTGSHKFRVITADDFGNDTDEFLSYCLAQEDLQPLYNHPPVDQQPVWFHKHCGDQDDIFYSPTDNIPVGSTPLYTHPVNLNCKSTQARLATLWGYEKVSK